MTRFMILGVVLFSLFSSTAFGADPGDRTAFPSPDPGAALSAAPPASPSAIPPATFVDGHARALRTPFAAPPAYREPASRDTRGGDIQVCDNPFIDGRCDMVSASSGTYYLVVESMDSPLLRLYRSFDGGESWSYFAGYSVGVGDPVDPAITVPEYTENYAFVTFERADYVYVWRIDLQTGSSLIVTAGNAPSSSLAVPRIVTDNRDYLDYWVYVSYETYRLARSRDQGATWEALPNVPSADIYAIASSDLAYGHGRLYLTRSFVPAGKASRGGDDYSTVDISDNFGESWHDRAYLGGFGCRVAVDQYGELAMTVSVNWDDANDYFVEYHYSYNEGNSWTYGGTLADIPGGGAAHEPLDICNGAAGGDMHIAYMATSTSLAYVRTRGGSATWWDPPRVVNDTDQASSSYVPPTLAGDWTYNAAAIAWSDARTPTNAIYLDRSDGPITVAPGGSAEYHHIQDAVAAAGDGTIIELADGTYTGDGNRDIDFGGRAITLRSASGNPAACVIDCQASAGNEHRGFYFHSGEGPDARLEGITITHGHKWDGGAIACSDVACSPTIVSCIIADNYSSDDGGGIFCSHGSAPAISACVITGNEANDLGGGIYATAASPTLSGCTISNNQSVTNDGGGLYLDQSSAAVTDCVISGNTAADKAAGAYCRDAGSPAFLRCVFAENVAVGWGGGLFCYYLATPTVTSCTFYGNAGTDAGGISTTGSSTVEVDRSIIAFGAAGPSVSCEAGSSITATCTDIYGNPGGNWVGCVAGQAGTGGNLAADPQFCDAEAGDFEIHWNSACADAPGCGLIGALPPTCGVQTHLVCPDGSGDFLTIQAAINAAADADTIELCDGTYTGTGNRDIDYLGKTIVVRSQSGNPEACIIDCQASSGDQHRGFRFHSGEGNGARLEGVSVIHGYLDGGGIYCDAAASPTIANCIIRNNGSPAGGGGVFCGSGAPLLTDCVIRDNLASYGGGVQAVNCTPTLLRCTINGNGALYTGGGIGLGNAEATVTSCTISGNFGADAGGISVRGLSYVALDRSIIAFSVASPSVYCDEEFSFIEATCTDIFGNEEGDWIDCVADDAGVDGNFSADPLFCDPAGYDFHIEWGSPCAEAVGCGLVGALPPACGIQKFVVCHDGSGDFLMIQDAINAAADRDTIELCDGTYTGAGNRDIDYLGKDLIVRSQSGNPEACVIDCQASAGNEHRGFYFHSGETRDARLEGVSIIHGYRWDGGAIACAAAACSPTIANCIIRDNYSSDDGGAIHCANGSAPLISACVIRDNTAADRGGGIHAAGSGALTLSQCVLAGNTATGRGGGLQLDTQSAAEISSCTLWGNAGSDAGGISMTNNSVSAVDHSIIAFSASGPSVACDGTSLFITICTDVYGNPGGDWVGCIAGQAGMNGNLSADPLFCDAAGGDFHIRRNSPCAEAPGCGLVGALPAACGSTLAVCPDGSGDFTTIQAAISAAVNGDIVELCDGTYTGPGNWDVRLRGKNITIRSQSGDPEACIIDCQGSVEEPHRGFVFESGEGPGCVLEGLTITHAYQATGGGGVLVSGAQPTIRNCVFVENTAGNGGAIQVVYDSDPVIEQCRFEGNHATNYGGACDIEVSGATFRRCEFLDNTCTTTAGAMLAYQAAATLDSCVFAGNTAQNGGALACYFDSPTTTVRHCTFYGNDAAIGSSVVTAYNAAPVFENCILAFGTRGAAVYCVAGTPTFSCSDIYGNAGGDWVGCIASQGGTNGNFSEDPLLCDAPAGDFGLLEASPCAPANSPPGCGLIGARGVGCESSEVGGDQVVVPTQLFLGPAVPNPLAGGTTITYGIPSGAKAARVVMRIYDVGGRQVATLVDADQTPGIYRVDWAGRDDQGRQVASGVYFCAIKWNGQVQDRRLVKLE